MHRIIALIAVLLLLSLAAVTAAGQIEGKVRSVDQSDRTVTLEDGTKIAIPAGMPLDLLREGAEITVSFEEKDGKNEATNVEMK